MANEKNIGTPAEEEIEIITLTDENGEDMDLSSWTLLNMKESVTQFFSHQ